MKQSTKSTAFILIAIVSGFFTGLSGNLAMLTVAEIISDIFINLLKTMSLPIVFLALINGLSQMNSSKKLQKILKSTIFYTFSTTVIAAFTAMCFYIAISPAENLELAPENATLMTTLKPSTSYSEHIRSLIPSNFIQAFADNNLTGLIILASLIGIGIAKLPQKESEFMQKMISAIFNALTNVTSIIISFMPFVVWAMISIMISSNNAVDWGNIALYVTCIFVANFFQAFITLPIMLRLHNIPIKKTFLSARSALLVAFLTRSSNATLPSTMKSAKKMKISDDIASFCLPMCATINMNGCAAFIFITVTFVAESNGVSFSFLEKIGWVMLSTVAAVGNAGVSMGCYFMAMTYLMAMGVPVTIMGLILPIYNIIDMLETPINVWSDLCISSVINKKYKQNPTEMYK